MLRAPDYAGGGLVNLVAELEYRLTGSSQSPPLHRDLAGRIPQADGYLLVLIDGLGDLQLAHPAAGPLSASRLAALDASFSTQTSVAVSTLATGLPPSRHGLLSYLLRVDAGAPINTLWWFRVDGEPGGIELGTFLPGPTVAERLAAVGAEAVVLQPEALRGSPLDQVVYRGARVVGVAPDEDVVERASFEAGPGRLTVVYVPDVDAAGHVTGTASDEYRDALGRAGSIWTQLAAAVPEGITVVGTADHGMVEVAPGNRIEVTAPPELVIGGDARVLYVYGDAVVGRDFAAGLPGRWVDIAEAADWWGPPPEDPVVVARLPAGLIVADPGYAIHASGNELPMAGYHGGLTEEELRIPLLVADRG